MNFFPDTNLFWTILAAASLRGGTTAKAAMTSFYEGYLGPIKMHLRRRGVLEDRIDDMTHEFIYYLMDHQTLRRADKERGRFRTYLLTALKHFMSNDAKKNQADKRNNGAIPVPLHCMEDQIADPSDEEIAEHDRAWAIHLWHLVYRDLAATWGDNGKKERFEVMRPFLFPGAKETPLQEDAAQSLHMSVAAFRTELCRLRKEFATRLRTEVARTVSSLADVDDEMRHLAKVLNHKATQM